MRSASADEILERMSQPKQDGPYVLGCFGTQVTFYRQQCRALNLIWAMFKTSRLKPGDSVAVIGGGLSGMTAAAAAVSKGCKVTLFEKTGQLMGLQRDNRTRYIHAGLNDWPQLSLDDTIATDLPFLNWYASDTATVFRQVEREWESFHIQPRLNHDVTDIIPLGGEFLVTTNPSYDQNRFNRVVLAVGFGEEREFPPVPFRSYWEDDSLHQGASRRGRRMSVVVSGCGDGGLIDALRLCLKDFNHRRFLHELVLRPEVRAREKEILGIDEQARKLTPADVPIFMLESYKGLKFDLTLLDWMKEQLREAIDVTLHDRQYSPLGLKSSRINRLSVHLLIQLQKIRYHRGEIAVAYDSKGKPSVTINQGYQSPTVIYCDHVVIRHGPERIVGQLVSDETVKKLEALDQSDDPTGWPQWDKDFYAPRPSRGQARAIAEYIRRKNLIHEPNREFVLLPMLLPSPSSVSDDLFFAAVSRLNRMAEEGDTDAREAVKSGEPSKMRQVLRREADRTWHEHINLRNQIARLAWREGKYDEAWSETEGILKLEPKEREAINIQGLIRHMRSDPDASKEFQRVFDLSDGASDEDRTWRTKSLNNLGLVELKRKDLDEAEHFFNRSLAEGEAIGETMLRTVVQSNLGYIAIQREQFDPALEILNKVLDEEKNLGRQDGVAYVLDDLGLAWLGKARSVPVDSPARKDLLDKAKVSFVESRAVFSRLRNHHQMACCEEHLGEVLEAGGSPDEAQRSWSKASAIFRTIGATADVERIQTKIDTPISSAGGPQK